MGRDANTRSAAVWLLQSYVFLLAVLPGTFVIGPLGAFGSPASKCVAAVEAKCPPAEKPITPMRSGRTP